MEGVGDLNPRWKSKVDTHAPEYQRNRQEMEGLVGELHERLRQSLNQGDPKSIDRHLKSGQLLARDRIELVLDQDSPYLELMPLAGYGQDGTELGGSVVGGIGLVCGVECMVSASVSTIKGGAMNEISVMKSLRLSEIAYENRLPCISLIQSLFDHGAELELTLYGDAYYGVQAGADLRQQDKVFHRGGAAFRELAKRSKAGLPTISVVFGSSTAGGAYNPGMSDYVIMVKNQAKVFLGGPPLVKMATGEEVDDESLGGADMHSRVSGVSDFLAVNEHDAILKARQVVHNLHWRKKTELPRNHFSEHIEEPFYDPEEILGVASANIRIPFDAREVIARVTDGSRFTEFKPLYGATLVTCFANVFGIPVGIISNNGVLFSEAACKGTQFIELCNQRDIPILFLQNITGFMVGKKYEEGGMIKHGSKFINAVSNSGVPHITILMGASYGAGNYGMCGRAYKPRFLFSWPNSKCSVMGPDQLTGVMDIVFREAAKKAGKAIDEQQATMRKEMFRQVVEDQSSAYYTSSRIIDDGIIDPRDTRNVLGLCLSVIYSGEVKGDNTCGVSRL